MIKLCESTGYNNIKRSASQFPEKYCSVQMLRHSAPGWDMSAWIASTAGRQALTIALSGMIRSKEISLSHAEEIVTMVMRTNAGKLYHIPTYSSLSLSISRTLSP